MVSAKDELGFARDEVPDEQDAARRGVRAHSDGLVTFVALAWGTTWVLSFPLAWSWAQGLTARPFMFALAGLSAFGPSFAAFVVARRQGRLREVFGRFRASPAWLVAALLTPLCLHLLARAGEHALGGDVERWFWLPQTSAQIAALFMFSIGEEFGWRGFAHERLLERYGAVVGPFVTGLIWAVWHLLYSVSPEGRIDAVGFALMLVQITLWGPIVAWFFERTRRSMGVAISIHAGAHLDNASQIPADQLRMKLLMLLVLAVAAVLAARSLKASAGAQRAR